MIVNKIIRLISVIITTGYIINDKHKITRLLVVIITTGYVISNNEQDNKINNCDKNY